MSMKPGRALKRLLNKYKLLRDARRIRSSKLFDENWYLQKNKDLTDAGIEPVSHYILHGFREGRDPSNIFSTEGYLKNNPDVMQAAINPLLHYIKHGRREGRKIYRSGESEFVHEDFSTYIVGRSIYARVLDPSVPLLEKYPGRYEPNPSRLNVLLVSHEASRTGAPILVLNLANSLRREFNVTILSLRGGELIGSFCEVAAEVLVSGKSIPDEIFFQHQIKYIAQQRNFACAIVNSVESRHVLHALKMAQIATVALIHEFASYTLPRSAFSHIFANADDVVFSTNITLDDALRVTGQPLSPKVHVLPQGRCRPPVPALSDDRRQMEQWRLKSILRPETGAERRFVVIGAGSVQYRKGVDLFIEIARQVVKAKPSVPVYFAWIGAGYKPDEDALYSVYLKDQLERSGLADRMVFISETAEIEYAFSLSDLLVLSGRLDPLPNVAIDAMCLGVPVTCFARTTGIADVLRQAGLEAECVADYLSNEDMAAKISALVDSEDLYLDVQKKTIRFAQANFLFDDYAAKIIAIGRSARERLDMSADDIDIIAKSEYFEPYYALPARMNFEDASKAASYYITENGRDGLPRRPEPGFHPAMFWRHLAKQGMPTRDAYAEFVRQGRPAGPWLTRIIRETDPARPMDGPGRLPVALHIHAYYEEQVPSLLRALNQNKTQPDLYVSVPGTRVMRIVEGQLQNYPGTVSELKVVQNRGRDIGPLITEFGKELVNSYEIIGHVHTKKSELISDRDAAEGWSRFQYETTLGGARAGAMVDRIVSAFLDDERLGIVFPADPHVLGWTANERIARELGPRLGVAELPEAFEFPVGTMFWIRAAALRPFVDLGLNWDSYPGEPLAYDGTLLHALERLFGVVPLARGFSLAMTSVKGVTR